MIGVKTGVLLLLAWLSYGDMKSRRLSGQVLGLFLGGGILVFIQRVWQRGPGELTSLWAGFFFGLISLLSNGQIGLGDVLVLFGLGLYLDGEALLYLVTISLLVSMLWGGILFWKRRNGKQEFPFVPFLLIGYVGGMLLGN